MTMRRCSASDNTLDTLVEGISNLRRSFSSIRRKRKTSGSGNPNSDSSPTAYTRVTHQSLRGVRSNHLVPVFSFER